jgi:hypothetical protein
MKNKARTKQDTLNDIKLLWSSYVLVYPQLKTEQEGFQAAMAFYSGKANQADTANSKKFIENCRKIVSTPAFDGKELPVTQLRWAILAAIGDRDARAWRQQLQGVSQWCWFYCLSGKRALPEKKGSEKTLQKMMNQISFDELSAHATLCDEILKAKGYYAKQLTHWKNLRQPTDKKATDEAVRQAQSSMLLLLKQEGKIAEIKNKWNERAKQDKQLSAETADLLATLEFYASPNRNQCVPEKIKAFIAVCREYVQISNFDPKKLLVLQLRWRVLSFVRDMQATIYWRPRLSTVAEWCWFYYLSGQETLPVVGEKGDGLFRDKVREINFEDLSAHAARCDKILGTKSYYQNQLTYWENLRQSNKSAAEVVATIIEAKTSTLSQFKNAANKQVRQYRETISEACQNTAVKRLTLSADLKLAGRVVEAFSDNHSKIFDKIKERILSMVESAPKQKEKKVSFFSHLWRILPKNKEAAVIEKNQQDFFFPLYRLSCVCPNKAIVIDDKLFQALIQQPIDRVLFYAKNMACLKDRESQLIKWFEPYLETEKPHEKKFKLSAANVIKIIKQMPPEWDEALGTAPYLFYRRAISYVIQNKHQADFEQLLGTKDIPEDWKERACPDVSTAKKTLNLGVHWEDDASVEKAIQRFPCYDVRYDYLVLYTAYLYYPCLDNCDSDEYNKWNKRYEKKGLSRYLMLTTCNVMQNHLQQMFTARGADDSSEAKAFRGKWRTFAAFLSSHSVYQKRYQSLCNQFGDPKVNADDVLSPSVPINRGTNRQ